MLDEFHTPDIIWFRCCIIVILDYLKDLKKIQFVCIKFNDSGTYKQCLSTISQSCISQT